jgi:soluble lytic murein transglycosylase
MSLARLAASFLLLTFTIATSAPNADEITQQRTLFISAEQALKRGDLATFASASAQLRDYPLYPYLEYDALLRKLSRADDGEVNAFLERYDGTVVAQRLRQRWLTSLAKRDQWQRFIAFYVPSSNVTLACYHLQALIETGRTADALPQVDAIWMHGKSRPKACDPVFQAWEKAGRRNDDKTWQRIALAMQAGETRLARYLSRSLSQDDRAWVARWIGLRANPQGIDGKGFETRHPYREEMLAQATRRLAVRDGLDALLRWQRIKPRYDFTPEQIQATEHYLVRNLVRVADPQAYAFVRQVDMGNADEKALNARVRAGLMRQDWPQVAAWIEQLPPELRTTPRWRYWEARAYEGMGDPETAERLYTEVAGDRSYYGFMAADRVDLSYHLDHAETPIDPAAHQQILAMGPVQRAREFYFLERWPEARREWLDATRDMDTAQLKAAAKIAEQKGWHDRAIFTLAKTGFWDDLELRFPLEHTHLVERYADSNNIDKAWIYAVMRQESAFMHNARSHAGAMGLMQLMPATARAVARDLNRRTPRRADLMQPETNIALGSAYLKQVKSKLGDSEILATAAYNAGPHRVTAWLPERALPADIWIELVPFRETRRYLQRVLAYVVIYEKRMGLEPTRLKYRLHPVLPEIERMSRTTEEERGAG